MKNDKEYEELRRKYLEKLATQNKESGFLDLVEGKKVNEDSPYPTPKGREAFKKALRKKYNKPEITGEEE